VEGVALANYEADAYKTENKDAKSIEDLLVIAPPEQQPALDRALAVAESQNFARTLVNEPGNRLTPTELAARAREMAGETGIGHLHGGGRTYIGGMKFDVHRPEPAVRAPRT
jgi:leucyl aminopeptidase